MKINSRQSRKSHIEGTILFTLRFNLKSFEQTVKQHATCENIETVPQIRNGFQQPVPNIST